MKSSMRDGAVDTRIYSVDSEKNTSDVESSTPPKTHGAYAQQEEDVPWTFTRVLAIASLCMVYVGKLLVPLSSSLHLRDVRGTRSLKSSNCKGQS